MSLFRSVGGKLALALLAVVACVLAIVYVIVVPLYSSSLRNAELATLATSLRRGLGEYPPDPALLNQWAEQMAEQYGVRAVVFSYTAVPASVAPFADSNLTTDDTDLTDDRVALRSAVQVRRAQGVARHSGRDYAEVATPVGDGFGSVAMFAAPLDQQLETVRVVRRRVLVAGGFAMAFAALLGYLGARLFTRRIRRLETAADRIAAGDFGDAVVDSGSDELGQLARTFERMRLRLLSLDRARGEFIANASHELRTPLFSLGGYLELMSDDLDDATRAEFLGEMREQVTRLTKLATDLLDLSRIDAGRLGVSREPVDLAEIATEVAQEFGPRAAASGHPLEVAADEAAPALGDAERALQIGRVLVENALIHTPAGTTVRIEAFVDGGRTVLAVADNGPGIPAEAREQIFHRFYRLEGTRASGSGLGLAIARELADVLGGRIELDSAGGWTRFSLALTADREPLHVKTLDAAD